MKKASRKKSRQAAKPQTAKKQAAPPSQGVDMGAVRQKITKIVSEAAESITRKLVTKAADGELAHSKYVFEMAGVYPMSDSDAKPEEDSLARTLLQRMGLPTTPMVEDENGEVRVLTVPDVAKAESKPADETRVIEEVERQRAGDESDSDEAER